MGIADGALVLCYHFTSIKLQSHQDRFATSMPPPGSVTAATMSSGTVMSEVFVTVGFCWEPFFERMHKCKPKGT